MADIALQWNPAIEECDWTLGSGDLVTGNDLETAVLISLFSDKVATPDFVLPSGETNPRGWWADAFAPDPIGSSLWQLERGIKNDETLNSAISWGQGCLQWMIDDGVAATVVVTANYQGADGENLALLFVITEPSGTVSRFAYSWAWAAV